MIEFKLVDPIKNRAFPAKAIQQGKKVYLNFSAKGDSFHNIKEEVKQLDGAKWNPDDKLWSFKAPEYSRRNKLALGFLTNDTFPGTDQSPLLKYKQLPDTLDDAKKYFEETKPYQNAMIRHILNGRRVGLAADTGVGKTLAGIRALDKLKEYEPELFSYPVLVSGPKSAIASWRTEIKKWQPTFTPELITNSYQAFLNWMRQAEYPPAILILDELSKFRNANTKRYDMVEKLLDKMYNFHDDPIVIGLTGTLAPKAPTDVHAQAELLCPGYIREKNATKLAQRLAETEVATSPTGHNYQEVKAWKTEEVEKFHQRLKGLFLFVRKELLNLPDKNYINIDLEIDEKIKQYAGLIMNQDLNALQQLIKLRQLSDGFIKQDEELVRVTNTKLEWFKDFLETAHDNNITRLAACAGFTESINLLVEAALKQKWNVIRWDGRSPAGFGYEEGYEPIPTDEYFQNNDLDKPIIFIAQPSAAGMGLTLTKAENLIVYSNIFDGEMVEQFEDRFHRIGTTKINIYNLFHLPTDKLIFDNVKAKASLQNVTKGDIIESLGDLIKI